MQIGILSVAHQSYSTRRLSEAAQQRGHHVVLLNTLKCHLQIASSAPTVYHEAQPVCALDIIIPRIGASITFYGTTILRQFEMMGVRALNTADAINRARNKLHALQLFSQHNIALPTSTFAHQLEDFYHILPSLKMPHLIKPIIGTQGKNIQLAHDVSAARDLVNATTMRKKKFFMQEFIALDEISDIRCFVIGKKIVASIKRQAKAGEFRANLHCGGTASLIELTPQEHALALQVVEILGLSIAGVDMLRTPQGPVILEVNASPGLEGIEDISGVDIAGEIVAYGEKFPI